MEWMKEIEKAISEERERKMSFSVQNGFNDPKKENKNTFAPILESKAENCSICNQNFSPFLRPHHCKVNLFFYLFFYFIFLFIFYYFFFFFLLYLNFFTHFFKNLIFTKNKNQAMWKM